MYIHFALHLESFRKMKKNHVWLGEGTADGGVRQTGQLGRRRSHWSTHGRWNECAQSGSTRSTSPRSYSPRHTAQLVDDEDADASPTPPRTTTFGSALIAASSIPACSSTSPAAAAVSSAPGGGGIGTGVASREHVWRK